MTESCEKTDYNVIPFDYYEKTAIRWDDRDFFGIPAGQFYLRAFIRAKTVLRYFAISSACYAKFSSLVLTAKIPFFIIQTKA